MVGKPMTEDEAKRLDKIEAKIDQILEAFHADREAMATRCATEAGRIDKHAGECRGRHDRNGILITDITRRVDGLEGNQKWVVATIIGGFLTAIGALVWKGSGGNGN